MDPTLKVAFGVHRPLSIRLQRNRPNEDPIFQHVHDGRFFNVTLSTYTCPMRIKVPISEPPPEVTCLERREFVPTHGWQKREQDWNQKEQEENVDAGHVCLKIQRREVQVSLSHDST